MRKLLATLVGAAALTLSVNASAETRTYALIVANNGSVDENVEPLRYADDDGARFFEIFSDYADEAHLLTTLDAESQRTFPKVVAHTTPPTLKNVKAQVKSLAEKIAADKEAGIRSEVYLVFTGHGNVDSNGEGYLSMADGKLERSELMRDVIRPLDASFTHVIIDACHAYFMVKSRGGWEDDRSGRTLDAELQAFLRDGKATSNMPTVGLILSTAGAQEVHEWSEFGAGVFSHQLRSGLLGAADADGDSRVTYQELEAYLVAANAAVTNPKAKIKVFVEAPKQDRNTALANLDKFSGGRLALDAPGERLWIEDSRGVRYADVNPGPGLAGELRLLSPGTYYARTRTKLARLNASESTTLAQLTWEVAPNQARSAVGEAFREQLFATPFGPAFVAGFSAGREASTSSNVQLRSELAWNTELNVHYALGSAILDAPGFEHQLSLSVGGTHEAGWRLAGFGEYGLSTDGTNFGHRAALGFEGGWRAMFGDFSLGLAGRIGPQFVVRDQPELSSDPLGLRVAGHLNLGWRVSESFAPFALLGYGLNVVTTTSRDETTENLDASLFAGLGIRW
jgi:hypothetical protein